MGKNASNDVLSITLDKELKASRSSGMASVPFHNPPVAGSK